MIPAPGRSKCCEANSIVEECILLPSSPTHPRGWLFGWTKKFLFVYLFNFEGSVHWSMMDMVMMTVMTETALRYRLYRL